MRIYLELRVKKKKELIITQSLKDTQQKILKRPIELISIEDLNFYFNPLALYDLNYLTKSLKVTLMMCRLS